MSDQIDHAEVAQGWLAWSENQNPDLDSKAIHSAAMAQAAATLALVEQQRIANLIAYWQLHTPRSVKESLDNGQIEVTLLYADDDRNIDTEVRKGLGL